MDGMGWYFLTLTAVGMAGLVAFEKRGRRLATALYLTVVLVIGTGISMSVLHWGWLG